MHHFNVKQRNERKMSLKDQKNNKKKQNYKTKMHNKNKKST